jgi:hypothetical protein
MLLTPVGTHEKFRPRAGQFNQAIVIQVPNPLVDQVQVDVNIGLYGFPAKPSNSRHIGMGRRGRKEYAKLLFFHQNSQGESKQKTQKNQ